MEQQSVTVAKSGLICSLPARTSILAAANPIGGQYDNSKTVTENLNISQPILSRFDLIFLLVDKPDEHFDSLLCNHIMTVHTNSHANSNGKVMGKLSPDNEYNSLSVEAAAVLQNYYLELRSKNKQFSSIPIFNRQLEAMIRLTEARAKLELRVEATKSDALDVIDILQYAMIDKSENYVRSKLNSDGKLTNTKVSCILVPLLFTFVKISIKIYTPDFITFYIFRNHFLFFADKGFFKSTGVKI
ncbi:DNA replication licensing factor MCM8 [Ooceraea biroi]|uniref:DNA replication licensing factor MCM8 n=1 Tax=Ooceraea biroi TaxID=2015173 RepID=A0A026W7G9_OOCBI|nr:DNA replication licensing factor MCM8 [Ooceraea biroi]